MFNKSRLSFCCKRFASDYFTFARSKAIHSNHVRTLSSQAAVSLAYERYGLNARSFNNEHICPLVIMHGMFGSKRNWTTFCKSYNDMTGREIISVDLRNHGESGRSSVMSYQLMCLDLERILVELDISKAVVMGHSLGGKVAMEMALMMPNYVDKLVVVDVNHAARPGCMREMQLVTQAMMDVDLSRVSSRKDVDDVLARTVPHPPLRAFLLASLKWNNENNYSWQLNLKGILSNMKNLVEGVSLDGRATYNGDTIFVGGANSRYISAGDMPAIREMFPSAELTMVAGAGHLVHTEKPKEFLNIVHDFLSRQ